MKRTAIITGGAGFIGTWLTQHLLESGYHVICIDNFIVGHDTIKDFKKNKNYEVIKGDFCDEAVWERALEKGDVDYVFHLGGIVGDPACLKDLKKSFEINVTATQLCAQMCKKYGVKRLVFASSCSVYGQMIRLPKPVNDLVNEIKGFQTTKIDNLVKEIKELSNLELDEQSPTNPIDFYGMTKLAGERVIQETLPSNRYIFARFGTAFGLSRRMRFDLVINIMSLKGFNSGSIDIFGGGDQRRPFTHCEDLARGMQHLAEKDLSGVFNIVVENFQIKEIAELVAEKLVGTELNIKPSLIDWRDYNVSNAKLLATEFKFKHSVEQGIKEIVDKLQEFKFKDYEDDKYYNVKLKY